jgi:hypothetical protein
MAHKMHFNPTQYLAKMKNEEQKWSFAHNAASNTVRKRNSVENVEASFWP